MERAVKPVFIAVILGIMSVPLAPLAAQERPACEVAAAPWAGTAIQASGRTLEEASGAAIGTEQAALLRLHPDHDVAYATLPAGEGEASSFGGMAVIRITRAGRYLVGMSEAAWVDVSQGGTPAQAQTFGPGAACSGIRKGVSFDLAAGDVVLEISGNLVPEIGVIVLPADAID